MHSLCTAVTNPLLCNLSVYMSNLSVSCRLSAACCLHTATRLTTSQGARLPDCQVILTNSFLFAHSCMYVCNSPCLPWTKPLCSDSSLIANFQQLEELWWFLEGKYKHEPQDLSTYIHVNMEKNAKLNLAFLVWSFYADSFSVMPKQ